MLEQFQLTDQVAIVTGGGKGIGAAIAELFAQAGASVSSPRSCSARSTNSAASTSS